MFLHGRVHCPFCFFFFEKIDVKLVVLNFSGRLSNFVMFGSWCCLCNCLRYWLFLSFCYEKVKKMKGGILEKDRKVCFHLSVGETFSLMTALVRLYFVFVFCLLNIGLRAG